MIAPLSRRSLGALLFVAVATTACAERDRLTFFNPSSGLGPTIDIQVPSRDTTVLVGSNVLVAGLAIDLDSVDVVLFDIIGGNVAFPPLDTNADTVVFSITVPTSGLRPDDTVIVAIFGIDVLGERGDTAFRRLALQ
ncbi:MAG: hypothetical protein HKM89_08190 [Gemmatimonadales bacterium]|nr:hypothetical protein [Gemmatimonadales bacterium]